MQADLQRLRTWELLLRAQTLKPEEPKDAEDSVPEPMEVHDQSSTTSAAAAVNPNVNPAPEEPVDPAVLTIAEKLETSVRNGKVDLAPIHVPRRPSEFVHVYEGDGKAMVVVPPEFLKDLRKRIAAQGYVKDEDTEALEKTLVEALKEISAAEEQ